MSEFTKGPWNVANVIDVQGAPQGCLAYVSTAGARGRTLAEAAANARLIASAPDLLAVAEVEEAWWGDMPHDEMLAVMVKHGWDQRQPITTFRGDLRRAAIAKATARTGE